MFYIYICNILKYTLYEYYYLILKFVETDSTSTSASSDWLSSDAKYILIILTIFAGLATFVVIGFCVLVFKKSPKPKSKNIIKTKPFP